MTHAVWFAAALLFALFGFGRSLSERFATGIVVAGAVMWIESLLHVPWTRAAVWIPMIVAGVWWLTRRRTEPHESPVTSHQSLIPIALIAIISLIAFYSAVTARETNADLLYFWGPKGQAFFLARRIDVDFLRSPFHYLMHSDYPPLQPIVYAWCSIAAHRFSYWGALMLTGLYVAAAAFAFRAVGRRPAFAALLAAVLAIGLDVSTAAGGADAQFLMFEVIALAALTFDDDATLVAAVAVAGAAFTKVEGAAFAAVLIAAYAVIRRDIRRTLTLIIPTFLLLGSWIAFTHYERIVDAYVLGAKKLYWSQLKVILSISSKQASYETLYLPWIAAAAPLAVANNWRRALLPLAVAFGSIAYTVFFYLHVPDASFWVESSAKRVLLTPLVALVVAASATSE